MISSLFTKKDTMLKKIFLLTIVSTKALSIEAKPDISQLEKKAVIINEKISFIINNRNYTMTENEVEAWKNKLEPKLQRYKANKTLELKKVRNGLFLAFVQAGITGCLKSLVIDQFPLDIIIHVGTILACIPVLYDSTKATLRSLKCEHKITKLENKIIILKKLDRLNNT